jgi:murein L,D-transpeptidase YcbB/YkuD
MLIYTTATVGENGEVHFFEDIYGHDVTLENALAAGFPYPA